jgi:hypothetical protein
VREARTHIPGFKPGITSTLAAVRTRLTGRTFVPVGGVRLVDGLLEDLPSFLHRPAPEVIAGDWEGSAEVHLAIGSNGKLTLAARAFDE